MDYKKAFDNKKGEFAELHARMDTDADLVNLSAYTLKDINGKAVPRSISVTLNDPAIFAANVESSLGNAVEQVVVESEDKKLDTTYIEDAIRAIFASADYRLSRQGKFPLNPIFDQYMCRRGRGAARCLFRIDSKTGEFIPDITPWDTRYVYYAMGTEGLAWAAYETTRNKDDIEAEYPDVKIKGTSAQVIDLWTPDHNEVYIDGKKQFEQPHNFGVTPVCIQVVPLGSMLVEKNTRKYEGESIFFLIRDLVPELERLVSLIQSLNQKELDHALLWKSSEGKAAKPPEYKDLDTPGVITPTEIQGGAEPVNFGQLKQQAWLVHSIMQTRVEKGSLSSFDLGTFTQPMSAVALIQIGEGRDQVFLPRLGARGLLKQQLGYMGLDQLINLGQKSVEIGVKGHKRTFEVAKLQGEYSLEFKYFVKSPMLDMARYQQAMSAVASKITSRHTARREIAQLEDPEGEERQLDWEEIEEMVPAIKLRRKIKSLYDMAERGDNDARLDAELAEETLMNLIGQAGQPEQPKQTRGELIPLLAERAPAKGRAPGEEETTPPEE